jgi:hypothetical protein
MMGQDRIPLPRGFARGTMEIFNPKKSVIIDMIMIQLLSVTLSLLGILIFAGDSIGSEHLVWMVVFLFFSFILASAIYSRITRV